MKGEASSEILRFYWNHSMYVCINVLTIIWVMLFFLIMRIGIFPIQKMGHRFDSWRRQTFLSWLIDVYKIYLRIFIYILCTGLLTNTHIRSKLICLLWAWINSCNMSNDIYSLCIHDILMYVVETYFLNVCKVCLIHYTLL